MTVWRPLPSLRVKVLGLHWREGRLLAAEVRRDDGSLQGVRPLGGSVEFGERLEEALRREFMEELGIPVEPTGGPWLVENLYSHEGSPGHEILFLYDVAFPAGAFADQDVIAFHEDDGTPALARWYDLGELDLDGGPELYPSGLKARLLQGALPRSDGATSPARAGSGGASAGGEPS